jgi:hypothetical protein
MPTPVTEAVNYTNITTTTTIDTGAGNLVGIFCASVSGGTIKVTDGANTIANTYTPTAGAFVWLPACYGTNLIVTIAATVNCTVFWVGTT